MPRQRHFPLAQRAWHCSLSSGPQGRQARTVRRQPMISLSQPGSRRDQARLDLPSPFHVGASLLPVAPLSVLEASEWWHRNAAACRATPGLVRTRISVPASKRPRRFLVSVSIRTQKMRILASCLGSEITRPGGSLLPAPLLRPIANRPCREQKCFWKAARQARIRESGKNFRTRSLSCMYNKAIFFSP